MFDSCEVTIRLKSVLTSRDSCQPCQKCQNQSQTTMRCSKIENFTFRWM